MSKHTPGPWSAVANEWDEVLGEKDRGKDWYVVTEKEEVVALHVSDANARLIAATPDMLAALRKLADASRAYIGHMDAEDLAALAEARAAIAKAEGVS